VHQPGRVDVEHLFGVAFCTFASQLEEEDVFIVLASPDEEDALSVNKAISSSVDVVQSAKHASKNPLNDSFALVVGLSSVVLDSVSEGQTPRVISTRHSSPN